jgi:transposase
MWLVLALVQTLVFAPVPETVRMAQVHILTGPERRRRFSLEQKRAIVAAAFAPGAVVSEVARQADVCTSLIYRWRRELGWVRGGFAEVVVAPTIDDRGDSGAPRCLSALSAVEAARSDTAAVTAAAIEIDLSGSSRLRIPASIPPDLAAAVIAALRRR